MPVVALRDDDGSCNPQGIANHIEWKSVFTDDPRAEAMSTLCQNVEQGSQRRSKHSEQRPFLDEHKDLGLVFIQNRLFGKATPAFARGDSPF